MADIVQTGNDKRLALGKEELVRRFPWGRGWSRIRVSCWVTTTNGGNLANGQILCGVCQYPYGWKSGNCKEAFVVGLPGTGEGAQGWTYNGGPPAWYVCNNGGFYWASKINGSIVNSNSPYSSWVSCWADGTNLTHVCFDFQRPWAYAAGQSFTVGGFMNTNAPGAPPADPNNNYLYMVYGEQEPLPPALTGYPGSGYAAATHTGPGELDALCISWNNANPAMQFSMINVIRYAA